MAEPKVLTERDNLSDAEMIALSALVMSQVTGINAANDTRKSRGECPQYQWYEDTGAAARLERALQYRGVI